MEIPAHYGAGVLPEHSAAAPAPRDNGAGSGQESSSWVVPVLVAVNVLAYAVLHGGLSSTRDLDPFELGGNSRAGIAQGELWRLLSAMFLHRDPGHLIGNMSVLWLAGRPVERAHGAMATAVLYAWSGIAGGLASAAVHMHVRSIGASGATVGILAALCWLAIRDRRLRGRALILTVIGVPVSALWGQSLSADVNHVAHAGGLLAGVLGSVVLNWHPASTPRWLPGWRLLAVAVVTVPFALLFIRSLPLKVDPYAIAKQQCGRRAPGPMPEVVDQRFEGIVERLDAGHVLVHQSDGSYTLVCWGGRVLDISRHGDVSTAAPGPP